MKKYSKFLGKFWFWVLIIFLIKIISTSYGVIESNEKEKKKLFEKSPNIFATGSYEPQNIAILNKSYIGKLFDGSEAEVRLKEIIFNNKSLTIEFSAPNKEELNAIFNKNINFKILDDEGKEIEISQIDFLSSRDNKVVIRGELNKARWLLIEPFKDENDYPIIFHIERLY